MNTTEIPTLVLSSRRTRATESLAKAWKTRGWRVSRVSDFWNVGPQRRSAAITIYGGIEFCKLVSSRIGVALIEPPLDFLCGVDPRWLHREVVNIRLESVGSVDFPTFIKSLEYDVIPAGTYPHLDAFPYTRVNSLRETSLLVSNVVNFEIELRAVVKGQTVKCLSGYVEHYSPIPAGAQYFLEEFLLENKVVEVCIVDIGLLDSGQWAVVELNPIWAADPMHCDLDIFIDCLRASSFLRAVDRQSLERRGSDVEC